MCILINIPSPSLMEGEGYIMLFIIIVYIFFFQIIFIELNLEGHDFWFESDVQLSIMRVMHDNSHLDCNNRRSIGNISSIDGLPH